MPFTERNHEVQAFPTKTAAEPLAYRVCLGRPHRRSQNSYSEVHHSLIQRLRENAVPVVDHKSIRMVARQDLAELLECPFRPWIGRHVLVWDRSAREASPCGPQSEFSVRTFRRDDCAANVWTSLFRFNELHLRFVLKKWIAHFDHSRPHMSLGRESRWPYVRPRRRVLIDIVFPRATRFAALPRCRSGPDSTMSIGLRKWPRDLRTDFMRSTGAPTTGEAVQHCIAASTF
jgi:hypothetical protein